MLLLRYNFNETLKISPCFKGIATANLTESAIESVLKISPCFKGITALSRPRWRAFLCDKFAAAGRMYSNPHKILYDNF